MTTPRSIPELEARVAELVKERNKAKRKHGFESDEYLDVQDKIELVKLDITLKRNREKREARKAEAAAKTTQRKAAAIAKAPERKVARTEKAKQRRAATLIRKRYANAQTRFNADFAAEQEEFLNGIAVHEEAAVEGVADRKRNKATDNEQMLGRRAFEYSSINGVYRAKTAMVRSHIAKYNPEGGMKSTVYLDIMNQVKEVMKRDLLPWLRGVLEKHKSSKVTPYMAALFEHPHAEGFKDEFGITHEGLQLWQTPWQQTSTLTPTMDVKKWLFDAAERMFEQLMDFPSRKLHSVLSVSLNCAQAKVWLGGSYVELPAMLEAKKACINVNLGRRDATTNRAGCSEKVFEKYKNSCFLFSLLAGLHPVAKNAQYASNYVDFVKEINMKGISEPISKSDIPKFCRQNPDISLAVYLYEEDKGKVVISNLVPAPKERQENHVRLLLIEGKECHHYVCIRDFDRLMNHDHRPSKIEVDGEKVLTQDVHNKTHRCHVCLGGFTPGNGKRWDLEAITHKYLGAICQECMDAKRVSEEADPDAVNQSHGTYYHCDRCMNRYTRKDQLEDHMSRPCGDVRVVMPHGEYTDEAGKVHAANDEINFKNLSNMLKAPVIIYADFEALTTPYAECVQNVMNGGEAKPPTDSWTHREQIHVADSARLRVVVSDEVPDNDKFEYTEEFVGAACVGHFIHAVRTQVIKLTDAILHVNREMTGVDFRAHKKATECHVCHKGFTEDNYKVKDHCHYSGKYRGAACNSCNINLRVSKQIQVVFHNLRGYDSHLMMADLGTYIHNMTKGWSKEGNRWTSTLEPVACTMEKYMSYIWRMNHYTGEYDVKGKEIVKLYEVRFMDSFQHLASSLDSLVKDLEPQDFVYTKKEFGRNWELMRRKGFYPYDWANSAERMNATSLPPMKAFSSLLSGGKMIDRKDYAHAKFVWKRMGCKTFRDYTSIYLRSDVALLADIFEKYRKCSLANYGLDSAHYMTSPSLAWDAAIKMNDEANTQRVKVGLQRFPLKNITDFDQYLLVERGKRGGITMIAHPHVVVDNKYLRAMNAQGQRTTPNKTELARVNMVATRMAYKHLKRDGDKYSFTHKKNSYEMEREGDSYILYLDANNLYGKAMSEKLPTADYRWADVMTVEQLRDFEANGDKGLFVEVDIHYPKELHDRHNDYPMAVESKLVKMDMLSPYTRALYEATGRKEDTVPKLVPNLEDKVNYVCHIKNLQQMMKEGLVVTKVHKILEFTQHDWLRTYIEFNSGKRAKAKSEFEKSFFKLMNNSVFGKTMENVRDRIDVRLVTDEAHAIKYNTNAKYRYFVRFHENLTAVNMAKTEVRLNKPIAVGAAILELSKVVMYRFHYDVMLKRYGHDNCRLLMTDTDSLVYHIKTGDVYRDMMEPEFNGEFDFSDYARDNPLWSKKNKKVPGYFKDEHSGIPQREFVGLAPKMYAIGSSPNAPGLFGNDGKGKKSKCLAKGVSKTVTKTYTIDSYRHVLETANRVARENMVERKAKIAAKEKVEMPFVMATMFAIRSKEHEMYLISQRKIALSAIDNKKMKTFSGRMYAYGHYLTPQIMSGQI